MCLATAIYELDEKECFASLEERNVNGEKQRGKADDLLKVS